MNIKLNISNKVEIKDTLSILIRVYLKKSITILFKSETDCKSCFEIMHSKVLFAQDQHVRDMGCHLVD